MLAMENPIDLLQWIAFALTEAAGRSTAARDIVYQQVQARVREYLTKLDNVDDDYDEN